MRTALIDWLCNKAIEDPNIVLLTADLGYSVVEPFANDFPERFFNIGVAEQNMVGVAAGMASEGYLPYTYSIGIFPTFRCAEQIRNDIDYHQFPVVTCAIGSGVTYGSLGYSHHMIQDLALMRSLPNTLIGTPADPNEVIAILNWHYNNPCPLYLRLHKAGDKRISAILPSINPGYWRQLYMPQTKFCEFSDVCVIVIGAIASAVVELVEKEAPKIPVFSMPLWGQAFRSTQKDMLQKYKRIITVEDHLLDGGFGSWLLETVSVLGIETKIVPITLSGETVGAVAREATLLQPVLGKLRFALTEEFQHQ